jgi:lipopolysaccharide export system ATP-binding protein
MSGAEPSQPMMLGWIPPGPSEALAVATLIQTGLGEDGVTLAVLAVAFRDNYVLAQRGPTDDVVPSGAMLSVDEAKQHLVESVLPRLEMDGVVEALGQPMADGSRISLAASWRQGMSDPSAVHSQLMGFATQEIRHVEAPSASAPVAGGCTLSGVGLTKIYRRRRVVDQVDVTLHQGEIVGLLGPNGAGKTTTFYMIVGLVRPDGGDIFMDGENIRRLPMYQRARRGIGYLAQEPSVFRKLTVEQNVMAILETLDLTARERRARLEELLDELTIKHLRRTPAYQLSGGERRRLEITRALVTEPKFMLLDEPFAGVDPIAVHDIQTIVAGLRQRGIGVLITDHNVEQTLDIVNRAYIMFEGRVQVAGTVEELVMNDRVADLYLGPTLTARLRERLGASV